MIYRLDRNSKPLIDTMVKTICDCCAIESEKVQLQIVKAILTLGTSPSCEVHGQSLLMCLRACYNIFLSTKNIDVQTSAKAVLTQIVCAVFQKMEKTQQASLKKQQIKQNKSETHLMCRSIIIGLANEISISHKYDEIIPYQSENNQSPKPKLPSPDPQNIEKEEEENKDDSKDNLNADDDNDDNDNNQKEKPKKKEKEKDKDVKQQREKPPPKLKQPPKGPAPTKTSSIKRGKFGWCVLCGSPASHYCIQVFHEKSLIILALFMGHHYIIHNMYIYTYRLVIQFAHWIVKWLIYKIV